MSNDTIKFVVAAHIGMIVGAGLILFATSVRTQGGIWVPCDIAEISPDIPIAAREECRRRKANAIR